MKLNFDEEINISLYIQNFSSFLFILNNCQMMIINKNESKFECHIKLPENIISFSYSNNLNKLFLVGFSGRIYDINTSLYFSKKFKQISASNLSHWRMLTRDFKTSKY